MNGDEGQDEETSGGTSGEDIWGTPTSGDLDDPISSPIYDDRRSVSSVSNLQLLLLLFCMLLTIHVFKTL